MNARRFIKRYLIACAVVVVLVLVAVGCQISPPPLGGSGTIAIGDSITAGIISKDGGWPGYLEGVENYGAPLTTARQWAQELPVDPTRTGTVLIMLGTNDIVNEQSSPGGVALALAVVGSRFPNARVLFVTIPELADPKANADASALNKMITDHGGLDCRYPTPLFPDGVHPTPEGERQIADCVGHWLLGTTPPEAGPPSSS